MSTEVVTQREPRADRAEVDPGEHAGAPRREERQRDEEAGLRRFGCSRPWPSSDQGDRREPKPRDDPLRLGRRLPRTRRGRVGLAHPGRLLDQARAASPSPTAAARSETPSFSYRCWTCVFTVVSPRKSSSAICGQALAGGDEVEDLLLARGQRGRVALLAEADLRDEAGGELGRARRSRPWRRRARRRPSARGAPPWRRSRRRRSRAPGTRRRCP